MRPWTRSGSGPSGDAAADALGDAALCCDRIVLGGLSTEVTMGPLHPWRAGIVGLCLALGPPVVHGAPDGSTVPKAPVDPSPCLPFGPRTIGKGPVSNAIVRGVRWLMAHQSPGGSWQAREHTRWCRGSAYSASEASDGHPYYDPGITGLAVLALLGTGCGPGDGPIGESIARGLDWLRGIQVADGCFGDRAGKQFLYNHAFATLAMVEGYGTAGRESDRASAQKALDFGAKARNPWFAWRYGVQPGDNDTSITTAMFAGVAAARAIEDAAARARLLAQPLAYDRAAVGGVLRWVAKVTDPRTGRMGYQTKGTGPARPEDLASAFPAERSESVTAMGVLCRLWGGQRASRAEVVKGIRLCLALPPRWNPSDGSIDFWYWYYGTKAMAYVGGTDGSKWLDALASALVGAQRADGDSCRSLGSWDPLDPYAREGGRVVSTAMAVLSLEASVNRAEVDRKDPVPSISVPEDTGPLADILGPTYEPVVRRRIAALATLRPETAAQRLASALSSRTQPCRSLCAEALGRFPERAAIALPALGAALRAGEAPVRAAACRALGTIGRVPAPLVLALEAALADDALPVRLAACEALGLVQTDLPAVRAAVEPLLVDESLVLRSVAVLAFVRGGGAYDARVAAALTSGLGSDGAGPRAPCLTALAYLGPPAAAHAPAARAIRDAAQTSLRLRAAEAVLRLAPGDAADAARAKAIADEALHDPEEETRLMAVRVLVASSPMGPHLVERLAKVVVHESHPRVREAACRALLAAGAQAVSAVASLHLALQDPAESVRTAARAAIAAAGAPPQAEVEGLLRALEDPTTRLRAVKALPTAASSHLLLRGLADPSEAITEGWRDALVRMGKPGFEVLKQGLRHEDPAVRAATADFIRELESEVTPDLKTALVTAAKAEGVAGVSEMMEKVLRAIESAGR